MRLGILILGAALAAAGARVDADPTLWMGTATVVSADPSTRLAVLKDANGNTETVELDDHVAGFEGIRAGDRVLVTLRDEPGRRRVRSIVRNTATTASVVARPQPVTSTTPGQTGVVADGDPAVARAALAAYSNQVAALAQEASAIDRLWGAFQAACNPSVDASYDGGRGWFSIWDNQVRADLSSGHCRDLYNQMIDRGEALKAGMNGAEDNARRAFVLPGDLRDVRARYGLDWEGWGRPAPDREEQ
jgi:hypothetical protein